MTRPIPLLAALALAAAPAAAEITLSGDARFGVTYDEARPAREADIYGDLRLDTRAEVRADNGLGFGVNLRMEGRSGPVAANAPRFYVTTGQDAPPPRR